MLLAVPLRLIAYSSVLTPAKYWLLPGLPTRWPVIIAAFMTVINCSYQLGLVLSFQKILALAKLTPSLSATASVVVTLSILSNPTELILRCGL